MTPTSPSDLSALCQGILQYLREHPEAADSLDGIAAWWLPRSNHGAPTEAVQEALAKLVAERRIACIDLADGRTLYQSVDKVSGQYPAWNPTKPRRRP